MADALNIALFGAGRMGRIHAANIAAHPRLRLAGIVDPNEEAAGALAAAHGAPALDTGAVFADPGIGGVFIASSAATHPELIARAVDAGKAMFCEKPLARSLSSVREAVARVEASGLPFLLGFNRRFDPGFAGLRARLGAGGIGAPELVLLTSRDPAPPPAHYVREAGGLLRETTIHDIDMARWLTGEEPARVFAAGATRSSLELKRQGFIDTALVTLAMPSGALVTINNSWRAAYGYDQRAEVHGAGGMVALGNVPPTTLTEARATGVVAEKPLAFFLERYAEAYRREADAFAALVLDGAAAVATAADGLRALEIAEAAEASLKARQAISLA